MEQAQPRNLSRRRVNQLLSKIKRERSIGRRIEILSRQLLGSPYKANPLIGSADICEIFVASLDGFDCVTYIETALALAHATNAESFIEWLRKIRYQRARIEWRRRNHYVTDWIRSNVREGIIKRISMRNVPVVSAERILNVVPGLAPRRVHIKCTPKSAAPRLANNLQSGDVMFFVSTRRNLDVFHAGIIARNDGGLLMRHASRTQGSVVEQELSDFLKANRMTGVIVVRPQEIG